MPEPQDRIVTALMEQLISEGPDCMAGVFGQLFNLAVRLEREQFIDAGLFERTPERRGYANGYKTKGQDDEPFYPQSLERGRHSCRAVSSSQVRPLLGAAR